MLGLRTDTQSHWNLYVIIDSRVVLACGLFSISRLFHILLDAGLSEYGLYFLHLFYIARTSARHDLNQLSQVAKVHITTFAPERIQRWGIACSRSTHNSAPGSGVFQIGYQVTASKKMDENGTWLVVLSIVSDCQALGLMECWAIYFILWRHFQILYFWCVNAPPRL